MIALLVKKYNNRLGCTHESRLTTTFILYPRWIKRFAFVTIAPFRRQIRIRLPVILLVQFLTQVTEGVTTPVLQSEFDSIVILPPEILVVERVVGDEEFEIGGQLLWFELAGVDVRMGRRVSGVIGPTVDNGN